jgi:hypothetical protein
MRILIVPLLLTFPVLAAAQAAVEAAAGASRSATSVAGPGQKIGKGIAGALDKLSGALDQSTDGKSDPKPAAVKTSPAPARRSTAPAKRAVASASAKVPEKQYESPSGIREGMEATELTERFGPPALKITTGADESYSYLGKDGTNVDATVRGGKVVSVRGAGAQK